ncbi:MAG TPA: hypothetical protein VFH29_00125 [Anaerolineales bacterium]|nr:hypothetical protein [Anaerolineales bacterium]
MTISNGILYVAAGARYIRAAMLSALSARQRCPDLPIHLYSDWTRHASFDFERDPYPFTSVATIEAPHPRSKVDYLPRTPFDRTLYLDSDTRLNADIREMFQVLDRFDLALVHSQKRGAKPQLSQWRIQVPQAFPQFNAGVILYRRSPEVIHFLEHWRDSFHAAGLSKDQRTLRELLWLSDLRIAALPPEYNVRYVKYHFLWSRNEASTKIFHLRRYHVGWFAWMFRGLGKFQMRVARRLRQFRTANAGRLGGPR